jgi:hypothetical protein
MQVSDDGEIQNTGVLMSREWLSNLSEAVRFREVKLGWRKLG